MKANFKSQPAGDEITEKIRSTAMKMYIQPSCAHENV